MYIVVRGILQLNGGTNMHTCSYIYIILQVNLCQQFPLFVLQLSPNHALYYWTNKNRTSSDTEDSLNNTQHIKSIKDVSLAMMRYINRQWHWHLGTSLNPSWAVPNVKS